MASLFWTVRGFFGGGELRLQTILDHWSLLGLITGWKHEVHGMMFPSDSNQQNLLEASFSLVFAVPCPSCWQRCRGGWTLATPPGREAGQQESWVQSALGIGDEFAACSLGASWAFHIKINENFTWGWGVVAIIGDLVYSYLGILKSKYLV